MNRLWFLVLRLSTFTPLSMLFFVLFSAPLWKWPHTYYLALGAIVVVNILLIGSLTLLESWTTKVWSHHHGSLVSRIAGTLFYSTLVPLLVSGTSPNIIGSLRNLPFWISWTCYLGAIFFELDHYLNKWAFKLNDELNKRTTSLLARFKAYSDGL